MGGELVAEYAAQAAPTAPHKEYGYRAGALLVTASGGSRVNVALASQGGRASASSTYNSNYPVTAIIDGERTGTGWGVGGGWNDATTDRFPDWVEVAFRGSQTIDEIDVVTLQDQYTAPAEPRAEMEFTQYGVTDFEVEYWNGAGWVGVEGGQITGNTRVWRRVQFAAVVTDKIRVVVKGGLAGYSRVVEVAAWRAGGGGGRAGMEWMVADQLGTPRMVVDETGSLAGVKRHDYLPFGEELGAGVGGRTTNQGYSVADGVRQGFTGYEKDGETGLNYAVNRYHSPSQGRFTSPDPLIESGKPAMPQSWNRYTYCLNNPLVYVDPDGLTWYRKKSGGEYGQPEWHDESPGDEYEEIKQHVYWGGEEHGWVGLNPLKNEWQGGFQSRDNALQYIDPGQEVSLADGMAEMSIFTGIGGVTRFGASLLARGAATLFTRQAARGAVGLADDAVAVTNPVPNTLARVIPGEGTFTTLGRAGADDVFVTAADDIAGMGANQLGPRLGIPNSNTFTIFEFSTPRFGLASPINRANPGFVGFGRTSGGAREFVIPNGPIPANARTRIVRQ